MSTEATNPTPGTPGATPPATTTTPPAAPPVAPAAPASPPATPPAATPPAAPATPSGVEGQPISQEQLAALQSQLAALTTAKAASDAKVKEYEDKTLSDTEKLQRDLTAAQAESKQKDDALYSARVQIAAQGLGIVDPEAAEKLLDRSKLTDDKPETLKTALEALLVSKPYLAGDAAAPKVSTTATNPARTSTTGKTFTTSQISDINFYMANEKEILAAMAAGMIIDG